MHTYILQGNFRRKSLGTITLESQFHLNSKIKQTVNMLTVYIGTFSLGEGSYNFFEFIVWCVDYPK